MDTFDASDFLREFDNFQPVDWISLLKQLNYLWYQQTSTKKNKDLLSQAMEIADISW